MIANFRVGDKIYEDGIMAIFPIITIENGIYTFVATAFFIAANGTFCTAKHVLYGKDGKLNNDLFGVFFPSNKKCHFRKIYSVINTSKSDIAIGMLEPIFDLEKKLIKNKVMTLSNKPIKKDDFVATYAYPKSSSINKDGITETLNFNTSWHFGKVTQEFPIGRDAFLMPGHCYQTSVEILGGASGGPVSNSDGHICGVNSTGYDISEGTENISFITPISEIFGMKVQIEGTGLLTIIDLAKRNLISMV